MKNSETKQPYMMRAFWFNPENYYWRNGTYTAEFVADRERWLKEVTKIDCGTIF